MRISAYSKAIIAGIGAVVTVIVAATNDGLVSSEEVGVIVTEIVTTALVFFLPNSPEV